MEDINILLGLRKRIIYFEDDKKIISEQRGPTIIPQIYFIDAWTS